VRHGFLTSIGVRLVRVRGQASQADFAPRVGIAKNTLGNYERGEREIGAVALAGYQALGWNANWLLTGEGPERLDEISAQPASDDLPLNQETLEFLIGTIESAMETANAQITPKGKAQMILAIHRHMKAEHLTAKSMDRVLRTVQDALKSEANGE
jgi:hypothetical protein